MILKRFTRVVRVYHHFVHRQTLTTWLVGSKTDVTEQQLVEQLQGALIKWPKAHLYVLDALIKHLKEYVLFHSTQPDYLTSLH